MAAPVINVAGDGYEDVGGLPYAYYANSGEFLFLETGNNEGAFIVDVQNKLNSIAGYESVILAETNITWIGYGPGIASASGTWAVNPLSYVIDFYIVKAANAYAMYLIDPAANMGSWSTYDLWMEGYGGHEPLEISHVTGYNPHYAVPAPATILLLASGLWGVVAYGRKKMKA
jgi:hypothetical protein